MTVLPDWSSLPPLVSRVRATFDPERLREYEATTRSPVLGALYAIPALTRPRTVALKQEVLETLFGRFGPDHAFRAFTPEWGIELNERQTTRGLARLLGRGTGELRASRIRAFLDALRVPDLPDDDVLEKADVLAEQDRIDIEIRFPSDDPPKQRVVMVEAKFNHVVTESQLSDYRNARRNDPRFEDKPHCRIIGLTPGAGEGRKGRQFSQWQILLWRDLWLQFERQAPGRGRPATGDLHGLALASNRRSQSEVDE